jgi:hypothetical protein
MQQLSNFSDVSPGSASSNGKTVAETAQRATVIERESLIGSYHYRIASHSASIIRLIDTDAFKHCSKS